jgi:hypothetical protein
MSTQRQQKTCDCGNDEFIFVKDLNLAKVWKAGNKYARICVDCGNRYFLGKAMWEAARDQFVILDGEDDPKPLFDCPVCGEDVTGWPDQCPYCDTDYEWNEEDIIEIPSGPGEADSETEPDTPKRDDLPPVDDLDAEDVKAMDWTTLQQYGAVVDGLTGSGVDQATLRAGLLERVRPDDEADDTETDEADDPEEEETDAET